MVVHIGRLAQEQRVELGDAPVVLAANHLDVETDLLARSPEACQGLGIGGRQFLIGIRQDGQVVASLATLDVTCMRSREVRGGRLLHEGMVRLGNVAEPDGRDAGQPPTIAAREAGTQERRREEVEELPGEALMALRRVATEVDGQFETVALQVAQAASGELLQFLVRGPNDGTTLHVEHRHQTGEGTVPTRGGEQRHVVALALVPVRTTKVVGAQIAHARPLGVDQVVAAADDLDSGYPQGPIARATHHDDLLHVVPLNGVDRVG